MGAIQLSLGVRNRAQGSGDPTVKLLGPAEATVRFLNLLEGRGSRKRAGTFHPGRG